MSANRNTVSRAGEEFVFTAGTAIRQGIMAAMDGQGRAVPASATGGVAVGVTLQEAASGEPVLIGRGCYAFGSAAGGDAVTRADVGLPCFVVNEETVKKTAGSPAAPVAGVVHDVDACGVWIKF